MYSGKNHGNICLFTFNDIKSSNSLQQTAHLPQPEFLEIPSGIPRKKTLKAVFLQTNPRSQSNSFSQTSLFLAEAKQIVDLTDATHPGFAAL